MINVIPYQLNAEEYSVFIILGDESLERMKVYDPAEVHINSLGNFAALRIKDVVVGYATQQDLDTVVQMIHADNNPIRALRYLSRGFAFRPDGGDYDGPPLSVKPDDSPVQ